MALPPGPNLSGRVRQIHHDYLEAEYQLEYYRVLKDRTLKYARHFDFAIGLGVVGSGGSGLGILGDPALAWLCGIVTSVSVIVAVAKANYDWNGKINKSIEIMEFIRPITIRYKHLIEDLNYRRQWASELEIRYLKLRDDMTKSPQDPYPQLKENQRRSIQNQIRARIDRRDWWIPDD